MKNETRSKLELILDHYEEKQLEAQLKREQIQSAIEAFLENFKALRENVIRPSMAEIGEVLEEKGHYTKIEEQEYSIDRKGFIQEAHIEFNVYPAGIDEKHGFDNHPSVTFVSDTNSLLVQVHGSYVMPEIRGERDHLGAYQISEVNRDLVEKEILAILIKAFDQ